MRKVLRVGMPALGVLLVALVLTTILSRDDDTAEASLAGISHRRQGKG